MLRFHESKTPVVPQGLPFILVISFRIRRPTFIIIFFRRVRLLPSLFCQNVFINSTLLSATPFGAKFSDIQEKVLIRMVFFQKVLLQILLEFQVWIIISDFLILAVSWRNGRRDTEMEMKFKICSFGGRGQALPHNAAISSSTSENIALTVWA